MKLTRYFLTTIALVLGTLAVLAQETITVTVAPTRRILPPQVGWYLSYPSNYFTVTLKNNTEMPQDIYMGLQIEQIVPQSDLSVITSPTRFPRIPISLLPGETKLLSPVELKSMFNHLDQSSDVAVRGNVDDGLLPEGTFEARLMAYKFDPTLTSPYPLSNPTNGHCTFEVCYKAQAPKFIYPTVDYAAGFKNTTRQRTTTDALSNSKLSNISQTTQKSTTKRGTLTSTLSNTTRASQLDALDLFETGLSSFAVAQLPIENPIFMWNRPTTNCARQTTGINYHLMIKEVMPGQSPTEAMDNTGLVYDLTGIRTLQCILPQSALKRMNVESTYVAQVVAESTAAEGSFDFLTFENEGKSEILLFRISSQSGPTVLPRSLDTDIADDTDDTDDTDEDDERTMWGRTGARDSLNADSMYTFRNPTLTAPTFQDGVTRKVFINDDMKVEWRDVWHLGGDGMRPDTLNFEYEVQLFNGKDKADREEALKGQPFYTQRITGNEDSILWDAMRGNVEKGDYLVLRVKPICTSKTSVAFVGDDLNVKDFAITDHLYHSLLNCDDNVAVTNTTPTAKSANDLKGTTVAIGQYKLTLDGQLSGSGSEGFSGDGHVEWNPLGLKAMVAVKFDKLKINSQDVVYEGIAKSYPGGDFKGVKSVQEIFSEWGVDNLMTDADIPYADLIKTLTTDKISDLAEQYNICEYYSYITQYGPSLLSGDLGNLHLPLRVDNIYNGSPINIQIEEMQFRPTFATMNLIGELQMPESENLDNDILILGAPFLCISPDRFLPETGNLCLLGDFKFKDPKSGFDIKFIAPKDLMEPTEGCYVSWQDDEFLAMQLHAEMGIPDLKKDVNGEAINEKPILTVKTTIEDWNAWVADVTMDAFQVEDLPGYTFHPGTVVLDHNKTENSLGMTLPKGYNKEVGGITEDVEWQGLYMKDLWVSIPTFIESKSNSSTVTNAEDATGNSSESKVEVDNSRIRFELNHLYIDLFNDKCDGRFSCKASLNTSKLLTAETNELGGWGISLDEIYVNMLQSSLVDAGFRGKFSIPLLKDSEGKKAKITYKAFIPSADKAGKRTFCFKTEQESDVSMDFFLADATFDKDQTYFFVEKAEDEDTRVELCMGGKLNISSRIAETTAVKTATSIGFSLPGIKFSHMRLANCPRWKSSSDDRQAEAYEAWLKEVGQNTDTEMDDGDAVYFDIGKWSKASPQKKVGGMDFNFDWPAINLSRIAMGQVGLTISGDLLILDGALAFGGKFDIWAAVDWKEKSISYAGTSFNEFRIKSNLSSLAGFNVGGRLIDNSSFWKSVSDAASGVSASASETMGEISEETQKAIDEAKDTYKSVSETVRNLKGFRGDLTFELPGQLFTFKAAGAYAEKEKTAEEISYEQNKRWDSIKDDDSKLVKEDGTVISSASQIDIDQTYTYAFLEIAVGSKALSSLQPIGISEISGGFYMNCKKKDLNKSFDCDNVVAQYGMVGGMLGIGLTCGGDNAITANGDLTVFYDMFHKRLSTIRIKADIHALSATKGGKGLINASATITYEDDVEKYFEVDVTIDAKADLDEQLAEFVGSDYVKSLKEFSQSSLEEMGEEPGRNTETSESDKEKKQKKGESSGHLSAGLYINVNFKITWRDKVQEYDSPKWHLYIGKPTPEKERCRLTLIDFALGDKDDLFAMWATIYADAYLCFGNELPTDDLPPIPDEISDYLGLKNDKLNQGDKDLNAEVDADRTKQFSTFKPGGNNGGVMFGAKVYGDMGLNAGIVYANTTAIAGFDVMLVKLKKGTKCIGGGEAGKNGWYGMGQVYALLKGEIGLYINMWLFKGHIPLIDVGMGALLKAGMPNPTWFYGKAKAHFRLLGGLIKGSTSVQLKAGEVCTPEFGNPLDDIEIFNEVTPGEDNQSSGWSADHVIDPDIYPSFTTNMTMETPFRLLDENRAYAMADFDEDLNKYSENASRTYRFMLSPDSIRLACYDVDQVEADKPSPIYDERVTYSTKNHELFNVASGTLDINKLYTLKLSGYAQEWRNGVWGDPFFNDSTTGYKDQRVKWYQSQTYYFRTSPKAPSFEKDVRIFNTDYVSDISRPTMALARQRKAADKFDDVNNPVTLRIEMSPNGKTGWESPSKIIHNAAEQEKYEESVKKREAALQKAYEKAMAEYEAAMAEYNRLKDEAHAAWVDTVFNPWMNTHYPGWQDWKFSVKTKSYRKKVEIEAPPVKDWTVVVPPHIKEDVAQVVIDEAEDKASVEHLVEVYKPNKDALKDALLEDVYLDQNGYLDKQSDFVKDGLDDNKLGNATIVNPGKDVGALLASGKFGKLVSESTSVEFLGSESLNTDAINDVNLNLQNSANENLNRLNNTTTVESPVLQGVEVNTQSVNQNAVRETTNTTRQTATETRTQTSTLRRNPGPAADPNSFEMEAWTEATDTAKVQTVKKVVATGSTTTETNIKRVVTGQSTNTTTGQTSEINRVVSTSDSSNSSNAIIVEKISGTNDEQDEATVVKKGIIVKDDQDDDIIFKQGFGTNSDQEGGTKFKEVADSDDGAKKAGKHFADLFDGMPALTLQTIYNKYNPAYGDESVNGPIVIIIEVDSEGNEEQITTVFTMQGEPYVEFKGNAVLESEGITDEQWRFLNDHDVPLFVFQNTSVKIPTKPAYGDTYGYKVPDLYVPEYQRDMDSKTFSIPIDEYTYNSNDYIFLRTKNTVTTDFVQQMKNKGYRYMRISVNRIHKKEFDDMQAQLDQVIKEYKNRRTEIVNETMGDGDQKGYDSKASMGKDFDENTFFDKDGSLNMDAYLNSYLGELDNDIIDDSLAVQKIRSNMDLKDFSECLYEKIFETPSYSNFKSYYDGVEGNVYGPMIRHQLLSVGWDTSPLNNVNTDAQIVSGKHWMKDPYFALGYWSKWAMIGGYPPVYYSDFPGLQLTLDKTDYRTNHSPTYTDGGHLLLSPNGNTLFQVRNYFMPNQYTAEGKDQNHRYGDSGKIEGNTNFMYINEALMTIKGMIYADCRMAAAIRNAAYDLAEKGRLGGWVSPENARDKIQIPYGDVLIEINDEFSHKILNPYRTLTFNNKASFLGLNVPIMLFSDYNIWGRDKKGFPFDASTNNPLLKGAITEGSVIGAESPDGGYDVIISEKPEISWRLDRDIAHQVVSDNNLYINEFTRTKAKSLTGRIKQLTFQSYRLNAFHTKLNSGSKDTAYDVLNNTEIKHDLIPKTFDFTTDEFEDFDYHLNM